MKKAAVTGDFPEVDGKFIIRGISTTLSQDAWLDLELGMMAMVGIVAFRSRNQKRCQ